jgi:hypothetical protein
MSTMPMSRGGFGQPVNEQGILMQDISQQRKLAEQLRKQGADELQGQMVSGHYVAPSWTQQLARVLNTYAGTEIEGQADKKEQDYNTQKSKKFADILAGNKPQQIEGQPQISSTMPAYTPEQQDQFGSPLPNAQREPVVTSTPTMTQESPEAMQARQQQAVLQYMQQYGNTPEAQYMLAQIGKQDDRAYAKGEKLEDRAYTDTREEKLYNRGRTDKLSDIDAERKYQDIVRADTQGFQVSQQDRQFEQQYKLQAQNQGFQAGQNKLSRDQQLKLAENKATKTPLSAAAQKEVFEADEIAQSSKNAIGMLQEAKNLNDKAYSGFGAKTRATIRSNLPGESTGANATVDLDNLMTGQALESLKATFGGMPTEGERKILLDMQASAEKTPAQRQAILDRAITAAERRIQFNEQKANALRTGEYFSAQPAAQKQATTPNTQTKVRTVDW